MSDSQPLKIIFAGTPAFAAVHLRALLQSHHEVVAAYTQPDRPAGRGKKLTPSPVKMLAVEHDIPVLQPLSLKPASETDALAKWHADIMVVVAYGLLLPKAVLDTPKFGCINVHGSLLPRWRGAAPIQRAIEAGDTETGITIMQMDVGLDTGDMLLKEACPIAASDTSATLFEKLERIGPPLLITALDAIANQRIQAEPQNDALATYAHKIDKAEAKINWHESADEIDRKIRAFNPFPIAYCESQNERVKIHRAKLLDQGDSQKLSTEKKPGEIVTIDKAGMLIQCGEKSQLLLEEIQLPGKKSMTPHAILLGKPERLAVGDSLQ